MFRNYVVGAQIQKLKAEKGDGIFVLGKSPSSGSPLYMLTIVNGERKDSYEFYNNLSFRETIRKINPTRSIRGYYHFDVSEGYIRDALSTENSIRCFYTSPNENAWHEKSKVRTSIIYIPPWTQPELDSTS